MKLARVLDREDPLAGYRNEFVAEDPNLIYLDGNSLGRLPKKTVEVINHTITEEWGNRLIRGWNEEWMGVTDRMGAKIARLIGARPDEVILTDTTSVNLFKLAYAILKLQESRRQIVSDELNFPSDLYILQGLADIFNQGHIIKLARSEDGITIPENSLLNLVNAHTALVTVTHVCFKSSFMYNMETVTRRVHGHGAMIIWDLSHATGAVPVDLNGSHADMAVGCTYKYLNGGPGSIAYLYVRKDLQKQLFNPIRGWFADANPFEFQLDFRPANDIHRFQVSSPPVLSAKAIEPGVDLLLHAGMGAVRKKSVRLTQYLIDCFDKWLKPVGFSLGSPRNPDYRGSHVSIRHPEAFRISQVLIHPPDGEVIIIPDFRAPDNIRLGLAPLYNSFEEVCRTMLRIREIVDKKLYEQVSPDPGKVT